MTGIIGEY